MVVQYAPIEYSEYCIALNFHSTKNLTFVGKFYKKKFCKLLPADY